MTRFTAILPSIYYTIYALYNALKNSKFPVWNDFPFGLTARQVVKRKIFSHSSLRMCGRDEF